MKKTLLAMAIAGVIAAPVAAQADSANATIYGKLHYSWDNVDTNDATGDSADDITGAADKASRIGFRGTEDLGNGMKAVWQAESQIGSTWGSRNTFVGLNGGFGTVVMGLHDTPYKMSTGSLDVFSDTIADYNAIIGRYDNGTGTNSLNFEERVPTVAYITPNMGGFSAIIARVSVKNNEAAGANESEAWSVAGTYKAGPLFATAAWEQHSGAGLGLGSTATQDEDAYRVGLGYTMGDTKLGFVYEDISHDAANSALEHSTYYLSVAHKLGANTLKLAYGQADDGDASATKNGADYLAVGVDHAFSKRTSLYGLYTTVDNDTNAAYGLNTTGAAAVNKDVDGFSVGIVHTF